MNTELGPDLVKLFQKEEKRLIELVEEYRQRNRSSGYFSIEYVCANGYTMVFRVREFEHYLRYKDLYNSPLYKTLL